MGYDSRAQGAVHTQVVHTCCRCECVNAVAGVHMVPYTSCTSACKHSHSPHSWSILTAGVDSRLNPRLQAKP